MSKKILLNIFVIFLLIFSVVQAVNIDRIHYDGVDHKYTGPAVTLKLNGDEFEVPEGLMPPIILEDRTLVPVREVFEILGGEVSWESNERRVDVKLGSKEISLWIDNQEARVDGKTITIDVPAKIINEKTMVPVRFISEQAGLLVSWNPDTKTVGIDTPMATITNVAYTKINDINCLVVSANSTISGYKYFMLEEPYRLILDVENSEFKFETSTKNIDDDLISTIRFGKQENDVNRVVLDLKKDTDYVVVPSKDKTKLYFAMTEEFVIPGEDNANTDNEETTSGENQNTDNKETTSGENQNTDNKETTSGENQNVNDSNNANENNNQNIIVPDVYITSIKYSTISKRIKIAYDGDIVYTDMFLTNPNRIVIDIANAELKTEGPKEITIKNNIITAIRFSQYAEDSVRIVLDLSEKADYKIYERTSELQVAVTQPTYKNVTYKLNAANAQITLTDVDKNDITVTRNESQNKYILKFSSSKFACGEGEIKPEDKFVESIAITETRITIYDTGNMVYTMRQSGNNVVITVKQEEGKSGTTDKKVILIDAGHGGSDPGACNGSAQEKVFNLNIALYLYDLLAERDDVEVYMSRDSDIYLNREDRVAIATELDPDLIVSVHNNSLDNKSYSGTMVLYYNNDTESKYGDITSKECAQIVLEKLVEELETINRGVVNREDLHILSKTPCPSILCEISFISNDAELERLKTKSFQKNAAEAIYEGVVEILEIM